jgi:signal transduction histidine kinase/CheY-like chemotaxis protein
MQRRGNRFYKTIVIVWLTLSIGSVVLAAVSWWHLSMLMQQGRKLTAIRDGADGILIAMLDVETGTRGYVITGHTNYLEPFSNATNSIPAQFAKLVDLSSDDPAIIQIVTVMRGQSDLILNWYLQVVVARNQSHGKAVDLIDAGQGKLLMDVFRKQIAALNNLRANRLEVLREELNRQVFRANLTSMVAGAAGVGAGLIAFWLSQVFVRQQKRERVLTEAKMVAEHSSQEKTTFLANMSHEIRTPMNAILGFSELLQSDLREPRHRQYLQSIRSSAGSLLLLINDILDMSKIESGMMRLNPEPTDLREICDFLHTLFSEPAAKKGLKLNCHAAEKLPHALLLDRIRMRQILVNLVGNAVKFTDEGEIIVRVLWEKEESSSHVTLVIEVQDTGVGIPQDKVDVIFKPFIQAGAHLDKEKQGTGLGLSIVKRLVEIMGGTVTVASVPQQGSAFHLRFPHVPISARLPAAAKLMTDEDVDFNALHPATLLIVDDNQTNCDLIAGMFNGSHHHLVFGANGRDAVVKSRDLKPDVLLLDVRMPGMDGYEALEEIRKIPGLEFLPIIAVTASNLLSEDNSLKERFSGFVRKPFSKRELFNELADFLPKHPQAAENHEPEKNGPTAPPVPPELMAQLRRLIVERWPSVRDSVAINESKMFAKEIEGLGRRWHCEPLTKYAQKLLVDAEQYAVTDLEKHLGEFAALVEQLDQGVKA